MEKARLPSRLKTLCEKTFGAVSAQRAAAWVPSAHTEGQPTPKSHCPAKSSPTKQNLHELLRAEDHTVAADTHHEAQALSELPGALKAGKLVENEGRLL